MTTYTEIEKKMRAWRRGMTSFPREYIDYHVLLADEAIQQLQIDGHTIHRRWMDSDGHGDGMRVVHLIVETPTHELKKLRWSDAHATGQWFEVLPSAGSMPYSTSRGVR